MRAVRVAEHRRAPRLVERRPGVAPGRPARRTPASRSRRTGTPCRAPASRPRPRAPAAGPSGTASPTGRCPGPAVRRRAGRRTPSPAGFTGPRAARLDPRPGHREPVRVQAEVLDQGDVLPASGGSGRRRCHRCRRCRSAPGTRQKVSQIDGVRPSSSTAPSIWYADVATPQRKSGRQAGDQFRLPAEADVVLSHVLAVVRRGRARSARRLTMTRSRVRRPDAAG